MNRIIIFLIFGILILIAISPLYSQIMKTQDEGGSLGGLFFRREFNKDIAEQVSKKFVCQKILNIPEGQLVKVEIDALTASKSGELTTVFYQCDELKKKGLLFVFFNEYANNNNYDQEYLGYSYKNLEENEAEGLMSKVSEIIESKDKIFKTKYNNAAYYFKDLTFVFAENALGSDFIKVFYKHYDAWWNDSNFKRTAKRYLKKSQKFK